MLSSELEICLNEAFQSAREARHEFMTVEHLLLAIIDTPRVREILRACGADAARLRKELAEFIDQTTPRLKQDDEREVQPTLGFQRVLQRAVFHVQSSGKKEVSVARKPEAPGTSPAGSPPNRPRFSCGTMREGGHFPPGPASPADRTRLNLKASQ